MPRSAEDGVWYPTPDDPEMSPEELDKELATVRFRTTASRSVSGYSYQDLLEKKRALAFGGGWTSARTNEEDP